ncbi:tRNA (adenosine(37)-N6)-dimethylallyltransferase MiaA [Berryella wangjianweii]|uniref:tRNA dimethylallyltransferase n=1 Tax=Berryella wangjianweii TaxID=2734634 RepID=A0A6M8J088_9ACTN|nr:tRNA (adenosine(37)-N6)-dimethylallyltransferase MiaA [Berryella wangjianweii]QKF06974.1 tRNA (adenosine(37)-N6)-dimethylallyltransferase MiaA [Berryella wangjianweii]
MTCAKDAHAPLPVVCILGPTASGKSALAQLLAQQTGGEVVSADSMQVYRGMDIGTGKVLPDDRLVAHHCLDLVDPGEPFSAALFQQHARAAFAEARGRGRMPVLCGGTGFYVRAAIDRYDFPAGEQVDNPVRERYAALARERGPEGLWQLLAQRDAESAALIAARDVKRVVRALELLEQGESYARQRARLAVLPQHEPAYLFGLAVQPDVLRMRIDARVDEMFDQGLVAEVEGLIARGFREGVTAPQAIGYKEVVAYLDGRCSLDDARTAIKVATHRYAKRQRTWFRRDPRIVWLDYTDPQPQRACAQITAHQATHAPHPPSHAGQAATRMPHAASDAERAARDSQPPRSAHSPQREQRERS